MPLALAGLVAAFALAACGGDEPQGGVGEPLSSEDYEKQAEAALRAIVDPGELTGLSSDSAEEFVAAVRDLTEQMGAAIAELESIVPPDAVADAHRELVGAVQAYGAAYPPLADAAEAGDQEALEAGAANLQEAAQEFTASIADLKERFEAEGIELASLQ